MDKIRVGIVGCGHVAHRYAAALLGAKQSRLHLTSCTDVDLARARAFSEKFGIPVVLSLEAMLDKSVHLVCICTPNRTHAPLAHKCLEAGRNVIVEHPLAINYQEAENLCQAAARSEGFAFTMRQRRFLRTIQAVRRALQQGVLGRIERVDLSLLWNRRRDYYRECLWRSEKESGGVVLNQASHFLDILLYLFGDFIKVEGFLGNLFHDIESEDAAFGRIDFCGLIPATFECTTAAQQGRNSVELFIAGSRAEVRLGGNALERFIQPTPREILMLEESLDAGLDGDHREFLRRVEKRLTNEPTEIVDAVDGARVVKLVDSIYSSFRRDEEGLQRHFSGRCLDKRGDPSAIQ